MCYDGVTFKRNVCEISRIIALSFPFTNIPRKRRKDASLNYGRSRNITRLESINNRAFYELISESFMKSLFYLNEVHECVQKMLASSLHK